MALTIFGPYVQFFLGSVDALPVLGIFICAYCCMVLHSIIHFFLFLGEGGGVGVGRFSSYTMEFRLNSFGGLDKNPD